MTAGENAARCAGSIRSYVARETITNGTPASIALANGSRNGSFRVVAESLTAPVKSVLPATLPRPGQCFTVVAMPASLMPAMNAATWLDTVAGSWRKPRPGARLGGFGGGE